MRYYLDSFAGARPAGLVAYLAQYAISASMRAYDVLPDGGDPAGLPWRTIVGAGAGGLVAGWGGAAVGGSIGLVGDLLAGGPKGGATLEPACSIAQVDLRNVSPRRARWAEYLICTWARRCGWSVRSASGALVDDRNLGAPAAAPRPWSAREAGGGLLDLLFGNGRRCRPARRGRKGAR